MKHVRIKPPAYAGEKRIAQIAYWPDPVAILAILKLPARRLGHFLMEMLPDGLCGFAGDDGGEGFRAGLLHIAQAAEVGKQALAGLRAHTGNLEQLGVSIAHRPALAMIADGKAMALVANELDKMQHRRAAIEDDGLVFAAVDVNNLFLFRDRGQRLRSEAQGFKSLGGGVELAEAA